MPTKAKIKIDDICELRELLDRIYNIKTQIQLAKWALKLAEHILSVAEYDFSTVSVITLGFETNRRWQIGKARMFDVRQAGFAVHQLAKNTCDPVAQAALRVAGHAIGTGHMREHAMVVSDYAIKTINLKYPNDMDAVQAERNWQIAMLEAADAEQAILIKG